MLEILYLSVALVTAYQAQLLFRRAGPRQRPYALLLALDGLVAGAAFAGSHLAEGDQAVELVGAVALFGFVGLVMLPPFLQLLTRRALARERIGVAIGLARLRELLSPGMGARQERELLEVVRAVRSGDVDGALASLRARRDQATDVRERSTLDDRVVFTLLSAGRWSEATAAYERARAAGGPASVPLAVEMVRAYGELGDLERAVEIVAFLETVPGADEPALAPFLARARMILLAYAGRPAGVAAALSGGSLVALPPAARAYWLGTAHHFAGDAEGARAQLGRAVALSSDDVRGRTLAQERLDTVSSSPRELAAPVAAFADHAAEAAAAAPSLAGVAGAGATPATLALIAANLIVFGLVTLFLGSTEDGWVLSRAGANLKTAAGAGEPWRLMSSVFLHVGLLHLGLNMLALWSVGRLVERMLGWLRYTSVYLAAGLGGSLASVVFGGFGLSAGASGAIFGVVGAAIAELALLRRDGRAPAWRRLLLGNLIFVVVAQLAIGAFYPIIDQSAHVGGLCAGALAALALSPSGRLGRTRAAGLVAVVLFAALTTVTVAAGVAAAVTPYARTLARAGWERQTLGPASIEMPRLWVVADNGVAGDPTRFVRLELKKLAPRDVPAVSFAVARDLGEVGMTDVEETAPSFPVPPGWTLDELRYVEGGRRRVHLLLYTRTWGETGILLSFFVPEEHLAEAGPIVARIVASVQLP